MSEIPPENLPIYLQRYSVVVLCEKPKDNCFPVQQNPCLDTDFGCCSDGVTPKTDPEGSNCPPECGSITYSTVGVIPSNVPKARVWNINLTGTLQKHDGDYVVYFDFSKVNYKAKDRIFFSKRISGTLNVCGRVLDASKNITYSQCTPNFRLYLTISQRKWDFRILKETLFSINIQLNDPDPILLPVGTVMPAFFTYNKDDPYGAAGLQVGSGTNCSVIPNAMAAIWDSIFNGSQPPNFDSTYFAQDGDFFRLPNMVGVCPISESGSGVNVSKRLSNINDLRDLTSEVLDTNNALVAHSHTIETPNKFTRPKFCGTAGIRRLNCRNNKNDAGTTTFSTTDMEAVNGAEPVSKLSWLLPLYATPFLLIYGAVEPEEGSQTTTVLLTLEKSNTIYLSCIPTVTNSFDDYQKQIGDRWVEVQNTGKNFWGQADEVGTTDPRTSKGFESIGKSSVTFTEANIPEHTHKYNKVNYTDYTGNGCGGLVGACQPISWSDTSKPDTTSTGKENITIDFFSTLPQSSITSYIVTNNNLVDGTEQSIILTLYEGMVVLVDKSKFTDQKLPSSLIEFTGQSIDSLPVGDCIKSQLTTNIGDTLPQFNEYGSFPFGLDVAKDGGYCSDASDPDFTKGTKCCYITPREGDEIPNKVLDLQQQKLPLPEHQHDYDQVKDWTTSASDCLLDKGISLDGLNACYDADAFYTSGTTSQTGGGQPFNALQPCLGNLTLCLVVNLKSV